MVRRTVIAVFVAGIAGMIVGSIQDNNGIAVTFGLVTAVAAICLMLVTSIGSPDTAPLQFDERDAADIERRVASLVESGVDEEALRELIRRAVRLGRTANSPPGPKAPHCD